MEVPRKPCWWSVWMTRTNALISSVIFLALLSYLSAANVRENINISTNYNPAAAILASRFVFSNSIYSLSSMISNAGYFISQDETETETEAEAEAERVISSSRREASLIESLSSCDIFSGRWVVDDESSTSYQPSSCPFIDDAFNCLRNGRPDSDFMRLRWRPYGCLIPRLDGNQMLEMLRGKRLVFVGDSLNRNMWESLVCGLRESLVDKGRVFDASTDHVRKQGYFSFRFQDYNCSVEFVRSPFLVQEWKIIGVGKQTLRLDLIDSSSSIYQDANIIIFNTGHWWTHDKTSKGENYYQEGDLVYDKLGVTEAYARALRTWAQWVDANIDTNRTRIFFRGYSVSHYRGGRWNSGGNCDGETQPITNDTYLAPYPRMMNILESVIREMKTPVFYLNITRMTDYRKDGHPSVYRQPQTEVPKSGGLYQDCSHWCLPGVPDAWNELLYAAILLSPHQL